MTYRFTPCSPHWALCMAAGATFACLPIIINALIGGAS